MRPILPLILCGGGLLLLAATTCAQIDPYHRNLVELGYDQPLVGNGPQGLYAYYYYNNPEFCTSNLTLRAAIAPAYLDGELGLKQFFSPHTDLGIGFYGGAFGDNFYEVRQGNFREDESFDGYGGGTAVSVYHLLNPGQLIPLNLVARGGIRYTAYCGNSDTADNFQVPADRLNTFVRTGLRLAGKEPRLYPDLGFELSVWFERQWRTDAGTYGLGNDRAVNAATSLYWAYAEIDYAWTNIGHKVSFSVMAAGSDGADRFSAWRPGGVLPLVSEFPLVLPGYYYEELTAKSLIHFHASYLIPLDHAHRFQFGLEAATACLDYLPGFEQRESWQSGAGCNLTFTPKSKVCRIVVRYGYGFNALRHGDEGASSVGLLFQYDFERRFKNRQRRD